jgi:outer membrane translocation and assembly module TamA
MLLYDDGNPEIYGDKGFISNFRNVKPEFSHSEGATIAYNSPIGPIQFNLSKASNTAKLRGYISIGYRF